MPNVVRIILAQTCNVQVILIIANNSGAYVPGQNSHPDLELVADE